MSNNKLNDQPRPSVRRFVRPRGMPAGFISKKEAAKLLGLQVRTLDNWMRDGMVAFYKIRHSVMFRPEDCRAAIESCRVESGARKSDPAPAAPPAESTFDVRKCRHESGGTVNLPESPFQWCPRCGAIRRKGIKPEMSWVVPHHREHTPSNS